MCKMPHKDPKTQKMSETIFVQDTFCKIHSADATISSKSLNERKHSLKILFRFISVIGDRTSNIILALLGTLWHFLHACSFLCMKLPLT